LTFKQEEKEDAKEEKSYEVLSVKSALIKNLKEKPVDYE